MLSLLYNKARDIFNWETSLLNGVAAGRLDTVLWFHAHCPDVFSNFTMDVAAGGEHVENLDVDYRRVFDPFLAFRDARKRGRIHSWWVQPNHLDIVKFLHTHRMEGCTIAAVDLAAQANNADIVEFLLENRTEGCTSLALQVAAAKGYINVVRSIVLRLWQLGHAQPRSPTGTTANYDTPRTPRPQMVEAGGASASPMVEAGGASASLPKTEAGPQASPQAQPFATLVDVQKKCKVREALMIALAEGQREVVAFLSRIVRAI